MIEFDNDFQHLREAQIRDFQLEEGPNEPVVIKKPESKDDWHNAVTIFYYAEEYGIALDPTDERFLLLRQTINHFVETVVDDSTVEDHFDPLLIHELREAGFKKPVKQLTIDIATEK